LAEAFSLRFEALTAAHASSDAFDSNEHSLKYWGEIRTRRNSLHKFAAVCQLQFGAGRNVFRVGAMAGEGIRTPKDGQWCSGEHSIKTLDRNSNIRPSHKFRAVCVMRF